MYLKSTDNENVNRLIRITEDGKESEIYNGIANWLYEEEILNQGNAIWWSPDSSKLAFIRFDDTDVNFYTFPIYDGSSYDYAFKLRYPKPATKNPKAAVFVYDTVKNEVQQLGVPSFLKFVLCFSFWLKIFGFLSLSMNSGTFMCGP
jgi:hypothetical protein